jgi:hypothetical protein
MVRNNNVVRFFILGILVLLLAGCMSSLVATVKPADLPMMNGHYYFRGSGMQYFSIIKFPTVDGGIKKVGRPRSKKESQLEAQVVLKSGERYDFTHPVESVYKNGQLVVQGGNRPAIRFDADKVKNVEIHFSPPQEKKAFGGEKVPSKRVVYRVTTNPAGVDIYYWNVYRDTFAKTRQGHFVDFHHKRTRNFYVPVKIVKKGFQTLYVRLNFDAVYDNDKAARANIKTFHFNLKRE